MGGTSSVFQKTLLRFHENPNADVLFKNTTGSSRTNLSRLNNFNEITIYINVDGAESLLDLAETIIHEGIHAAIAIYLSNEHHVDVELENTDRLIQLYNYYKKAENTNYADHIFMGENYVEKVAADLRKLDSDSYPISHYYGIVWDGIAHWFEMYPEIRNKYNSYYQYNSTIRNNTTLCSE